MTIRHSVRHVGFIALSSEGAADMPVSIALLSSLTPQPLAGRSLAEELRLARQFVVQIRSLVVPGLADSLALLAKGRDAWSAWAGPLVREREDLIDRKRIGFSLEGKLVVDGADATDWLDRSRLTFAGHRFIESSFHGLDHLKTFRSLAFPGPVDFRGAVFDIPADFSGQATFLADVDFSNAIFNSRWTDDGPNAQAWEDQGRDGLPAACKFGASSFAGRARFTGALFRGSALFGQAAFSRLFCASNATFSDNAKFGGAQFQGETRFHGARLDKSAWFGSRALFKGQVYFDRCRFLGDVRFDDTLFEQSVSFRDAEFLSNPLVAGARPGSAVHSDGVRFPGQSSLAAYQGLEDFFGVNRPPPAIEGSAAQVFVSYTHYDVEQVRSLVACLRKAGLSVWWDEQLRCGNAWEPHVLAYLHAADAVIICWTPRAVQSEWVKKEAECALRRSQAGSLKVLAPILFDQCLVPDKLPGGYNSIHAIRIGEPKYEDSGMRLLLDVLRNNLMGNQPSPNEGANDGR